jgi:AraC-like DNA-binding protein
MARPIAFKKDLPSLLGRQAVPQMAQVLADPFFAEVLFDQLTDVVFFVKDTSGCYVVVNQTLMQRCGCRRKSELIGHSPLELFPAELGASYASQDQYVIRSGQVMHNQLEMHLYTNQTPCWCLTQKIPLFDGAGQIIGLAGISKDVRMPDKNHPVYQHIADVVAYIQKNYAEQMKLERLARMGGMSVTQLERHIQRIFQLTPKQLIIKVRIEAAIRLLLESERSVADIAYACGYADHSAFSRQFKTVVGLSPMDYRKLSLQKLG